MMAISPVNGCSRGTPARLAASAHTAAAASATPTTAASRPSYGCRGGGGGGWALSPTTRDSVMAMRRSFLQHSTFSAFGIRHSAFARDADALEHERLRLERRVRHDDGPFEQAAGLGEPPPAAVMDLDDRLSARDAAADRRDDREADGRIDDGVEAIPAGAEQDGRPPDGFRLHGGDDTVAGGRDHVAIGHRRQHGVVVDHPRIAPLIGDDLAELLDAGSRRERRA